MKKPLSFCLLILGFNGIVAYADPVLWFNGAPAGTNLINGINTQSVPVSNVYDDFIVPVGQNWNVTGVFSNNSISNFTPTQAEWEIRSGVSVGNGGTVVASGTNAATLTAVSGNIFTVAVSGLNVSLSAGTYWLTVAPVGVLNTTDQSFLMQTSGANAVGLPAGNDGNAFWNGPSIGENFVSTAGPSFPNIPDFSMGVSGTVAGQSTPEPSATVLLAGGVLALAGLARRRAA